MGNEFQAPKKLGDRIDNREYANVHLGSTDRIIGGILAAVLIALVLWVGQATQQNQVELAKLGEKFESTKRERDISLLYIEKRLEKLELSLELLKQDEDAKKK